MGEKLYRNVPVGLIPWKPTIDYSACNGNGKCIAVCPTDVFSLNVRFDRPRKAEVVRPEDCRPLCHLCFDACPKKAITLPDRKETEKLISKLLKQYSNEYEK